MYMRTVDSATFVGRDNRRCCVVGVRNVLLEASKAQVHEETLPHDPYKMRCETGRNASKTGRQRIQYGTNVKGLFYLQVVMHCTHMEALQS